MIKLHLFPYSDGAQASYPCAKLDIYLRLAGIDYERVESWDLPRAPKAKFPYIEHGDFRLGDSWFILRYLKEQFGDPLDAGLKEIERAQAYSLMQLLDTSLYHALAFVRWFDADGEAIMIEAFFGAMPEAEKQQAVKFVKDAIYKQTYYQGYGRHSVDEVYQIIENDMAVFETLLQDNDFLMATRTPTTVDVCLTAFLEGAFDGPAPPRLKQLLKKFPAVLQMKNRLQKLL